MSRINIRFIALLLVCLAAGAAREAKSEFDQDVPQQALLAPWPRVKAAVLLLPASIDDIARQGKSAELDLRLAGLESTLADLVTQMDTVATRIAVDPQFVYAAEQFSADMAAQVAAVRRAFDAVFSAPAPKESADVRATQESLDTLRRILSEKYRLERDVMRVFGAFSGPQILALATRWTTAANSVAEAKEAVARARSELAARSGGGSSD